jgi:hypothetical protein
LVPALLPLAITFHLLREVLAVLLPITRVSLASLVRTLPANLPVKRVGSDVAPVIIAPALPLAIRLDCKRVVGDDKGQAERLADNKDRGDHASGGSGSECDGIILFGTTNKLVLAPA